MDNRTLHENLLDPRLLSPIWIAVLLSTLFRDVHEFLRDDMIRELAEEGTVRGDEVAGSTLLASGVFLQLPLAMVVLSTALPRRANRMANRVVATLMAFGVLAFWPKDADDLVFGAGQLVALALVGVICHRWTDDVTTPAAAPHPAGAVR